MAERYFLETARLGLRRLRAEDVDALRDVFADPVAARFYPTMREQLSVERWIRWNLAHYEEHGFGLWALERLDTGTFIGDAGITWQTVEGTRIHEIGWHVHPAHRSMGFATEAARASLDFGFDRLGAPMIGSIVDPANDASIQVASRVHASRRTYAGKSGPMLLFGTTRAEHQAAQAGRSDRSPC